MIGIKRRSSIYYPIKEYYKRRIMVGDVLANKTLYADFPDNFINKVTYYPDETGSTVQVTNLILTDGSSNIDIFKANLNQSFEYKPEINISTYTITSPTTITDYNEFDFWSQFILVDETTL